MAKHTREGVPLAPVCIRMETGQGLKKGKTAFCADAGWTSEFQETFTGKKLKA